MSAEQFSRITTNKQELGENKGHLTSPSWNSFGIKPVVHRYKYSDQIKVHSQILISGTESV